MTAGLLVVAALATSPGSAAGNPGKDSEPQTAARRVVQPPYLVKDIAPGPASAQIGTEMVGSFFTAASAGDDMELWSTGGSPATTKLVADINPGPAGSHPSHMTSFNDRVYFFADNGTSGRELWASDGTAAGTVMVKELNPGAGDGIGDPGQDMSVAVGRLFFAGQDATGNLEPWVSDGTSAGTVELAEVSAVGGSDPRDFGVAAGGAWFSATNAGSGREPWFSDGTPAGTHILADVQPGPGSSAPHDQFGLYFAAQAAPGNDELHVAASPTGPVTLVKDIRPGPVGSNPTEIQGGFADHPRLLVATNAAGSREIWTTDGTEAGTTQLTNLGPGADPRELRPGRFNGVIFSANSGGTGREPWGLGYLQVGNPDPVTTKLLADLEPGPGSSDPRQFVGYLGASVEGDALISDTTAYGSEISTIPWGPDGPRVLDFAAGPADGVDRILGGNGAVLYFVGNNGTAGRELYAIDLEPQHVVDPTTLRITAPRRVTHSKDARKRIKVRVFIQRSPEASIDIGAAYGRITLYVGKRVVGRVIARNGIADARITKVLGTGKHRVFARYAGNPYFDPSRSPRVTIKVLPRRG